MISNITVLEYVVSCLLTHFTGALVLVTTQESLKNI
jgi:hypothetical protein